MMHLKLYTSILVVGCHCVMALIPESKEAVENESNFEESERIVGGKPATDGMYPWAVALFHEGGYICTASIISETCILTAAHCVVFNNVTQMAYSFHGVIGSVNKSSSDATYIGFKNVEVHPGYEELNNDVAILETTEPIKFSKKIQKICIANSKMGRMVLKRVVALGWGGIRDQNNNETPDILMFVSQTIVSNLKCFILYFGNPIPSSAMCATGLNSGVCTGDSGGPLVYYAGKLPIQVGIASYINGIIGCGHLLGPAVSSRVSSYTDYIMKTASGSICVA